MLPMRTLTISNFQTLVSQWMKICFSREVCEDTAERNHRFLEEALELVQARGCTADECHQLVEYTFGRPQGEINQEVGGVGVTLAALCMAGQIDMSAAFVAEIERISRPDVIEKIRAKQAAKPKFSPLPQAWKPKERWESIDTAPKDRRIRFWCPTKPDGYREQFGSWEAQTSYKNPRPYWAYSRFVEDDRAHQPTHWLPTSEGPAS